MKGHASRTIFSLFSVIVAILLSIGLAAPGGAASAQGEQPPTPYTTVDVGQADGTVLRETIINGPPKPPAGFEMQRAAVQVFPASAQMLTVPAFSWVFGCSSVSAAMIAGYYDRNSYINMYTGPTNGHVMPLYDTAWPRWSDAIRDSYPNNPLIASHSGVDGRTAKGSIDDYWIQYGSGANDPYVGKWGQHGWGSSIGDYMKTSQSAYGNTDGSTQFWGYNDSTKLTCSAMEGYSYGGRKISQLDGTYGRKLFYQAQGYTVTDCYNQNTDNNAAGGFTLAQYRAEIDAGRPVFLNLAGHSIVGVGYDPASSTIYIHDTWDQNNHTMQWGGSYSGMEMLSVSMVTLGPWSTPTIKAPVGTITNTNPTYSWTKVDGATSYQLTVLSGGLPVFTKVVAPAACGLIWCASTPATALILGSYTWKVQAMTGGMWQAYSVPRAFSVTNVPILLSPAGKITDTTPTFKWGPVSGATAYQYQVFRGTTLVLNRSVAASACVGGTCSNTPGNVLALAAYTWKVRAVFGTAYKPWSASKAFTVAAK